MTTEGANTARGRTPACWPAWLPDGTRHYLAHVAGGTPIRALARDARVHASTILRQVRRVEALRDDPLVDDALRDLAQSLSRPGPERKETAVSMAGRGATAGSDSGSDPGTDTSGGGARPPLTEARIAREAVRILRRLTETGAMLAVARDMEMGVVIRDGADGAPQRLAVVEREIAQAMALKDWIASVDPGARIARYGITAAGRAELRRMLSGAGAPGMAEAPARFAGAEPEDDRTLRHMRSLLGDSPVTALARRQDRNGRPFLGRDLVAAAERLREDFELSNAGPQIARNWDGFLTAGIDAGPKGDAPRGAQAARDRLAAALADLGPGLADVALRCCCFLEGLESIEERMEWSARSGKIVLRIALQRLRRHYEETQGRYGPPIG